MVIDYREAACGSEEAEDDYWYMVLEATSGYEH